MYLLLRVCRCLLVMQATEDNFIFKYVVARIGIYLYNIIVGWFLKVHCVLLLCEQSCNGRPERKKKLINSTMGVPVNNKNNDNNIIQV